MSEREQFEAWVRSKDSAAPMHRRDMKGSERIGQYCTHWIQDQWESWQASRRAALDEAAGIVDAEAENARQEHYYPGVVGAFEECAAAIRALASGDAHE